jgi:hypothetical protein
MVGSDASNSSQRKTALEFCVDTETVCSWRVKGDILASRPAPNAFNSNKDNNSRQMIVSVSLELGISVSSLLPV